MLIGRMVHDQVGDYSHPAGMDLVYHQPEFFHRAVVGVDAVEAGDVIAIILQR